LQLNKSFHVAVGEYVGELIGLLLFPNYQYKTILSHATILSYKKHTIFLSGSYLETQKPDGDHTNRRIIPKVSLNAIACLPLVVLEFFVLLYAIEKVGSKNYSAKKKAHNWLRRSFLRIPSSDDVAERRE
jgi:hypothetical protein